MDVFNFPNTQNNNFIFFANGGITSWQTWSKPRNCKFVSIFAISGGGGGGGGRASSTIINAAGGGGGGASGTSLGIFPANSLPDTLYIQVGIGGAGGASQLAGNTGNVTYVSAQPNTTTINIIIAGSATAVAAGISGSAGGTGGAAPTAFVKTSTGLLGASGIITSTAGWAGVNGGTASSGTTILVSGVTTGGAGGGGNNAASVDAVGGNISSIGVVPTIFGGSSGLTGNNGYVSVNPSFSSSINIPMFFTGGAGGGSKYNGIGGNGGNGGYGCGGAGGGSGLTGGTGGNGGNGLVIITCF